MNIVYKTLIFLKGTMETPKPYGWFHLMWIGLIIISVFLLSKKKKESDLKIVLATYSIIGIILEILKQIIWSFNYDNGIVTWDYTWYAFPFQLCTTPLIASLMCVFLKDGKLKDSLLAYMAYVTVLGSIATVIMPDSCFVKDTLINIHTMWLHCGSLVVSLYILITGRISKDISSYKNAITTFIAFAFIANTLNVFMYESGILGDETFNMFYISPYFISSLPVFDYLQTHLIYPIYLALYLITLSIGASFVYFIYSIIKPKRIS